MMNRVLFIAFIFIFFGCNHSATVQSQDDKDSVRIVKKAINDKVKKPYRSLDFAKTIFKADTNHFYLINKVCAIRIMPDSNRVNEQKKSMSEDAWNEKMLDDAHYSSLAMDAMKAHGINVIFKDNDRKFIKFKKSNGQEYAIDRQFMKDVSGLILFNGIDDPVLYEFADNVEDVIKDVYKK